MKFKEKFKEVYENGQKWAVKHKWLCRVLAVVLALFVAFTVVSVRSCSNDKKITASADSSTIVAPTSTYSIITYRNPQLYVSWLNSGGYTSLLYSPTLFISSEGYKVSFGRSVFDLYTYDVSVNADTWSVQSQNPSSPTGSNVGFEGRIDSYNYQSSELYSLLISGDLVISNIQFVNEIYYRGGGSYLNYFTYYVYVNNSGNNILAFSFRFLRSEEVPSSVPRYYFNSSLSSAENDFYYYITYNGLSTSSAEYQSGYTAGYSSGQSIGYSSGYSDGETSGYESGYNAGISETLSDITPWQTIVDGVNSFLNIEILPNVKLSIILSVGFGVILLGFAIKIFLGG